MQSPQPLTGAIRQQAFAWARATRPPEAHAYTLEAARALARALKFGPLPQPTDPSVDPEEALAWLWDAVTTCGFNWLTGASAIGAIADVLELSRP
jgi:hypothetical protein